MTPRILIVDDDNFIRTMFSRVLGPLGQCDFAACGESAIALLAERAYDFVLLDLNMKGLDGFDVLAWLNEQQELNRETPFGVVSADASLTTRVRARRAKATFFLTKPVRMQTLSNLVVDTLRRSTGTRRCRRRRRAELRAARSAGRISRLARVSLEARASALPLGELFAERYEVEELLGKGGMRRRLRVRDFALGEPVALKLLTFGPESEQLSVLRFRQEVRLARRVTHPNIARVHDLGQHDGRLFLTMELIRGVTLRTLIRDEQQVPLARAIRIAAAILAGLEAAHAVGVIHRDLKPENVMVEPNGRVVITDFGIARGLADDVNLTMGAIGTPKYMAPSSSPAPRWTEDGTCRRGLVLGTRCSPASSRARWCFRPSRACSSVRPPRGGAPGRNLIALDPSNRPGSAHDARAVLEAVAVELGVPFESAPGEAIERDAAVGEAATRSLASSHPRRIGDRSLAVLPFRHRGPEAQAYLADALTDELVDQLARTRNLRVLGAGATSQYKDDRDPRRMGDELGAYAVVDGTVQTSPERMRVTARLIDARIRCPALHRQVRGEPRRRAGAPGVNRAAGRRGAAGRDHDVHEPGKRAGRGRQRVPGGAPEPAHARPRERAAGRRRLRARAGPRGLLRARARGPGGRCLRAWFMHGSKPALDWELQASEAVKRALELAPELAETHYAAALHASFTANLPGVVRSINRASRLRRRTRTRTSTSGSSSARRGGSKIGTSGCGSRTSSIRRSPTR